MVSWWLSRGIAADVVVLVVDDWHIVMSGEGVMNFMSVCKRRCEKIITWKLFRRIE